jgi:molecular chaperone DnaK
LVGVFSQRIAAGEEAPILGIDLGTCRSLLAVFDGEEPRLVPLDEHRSGIPSVVASGPGEKLLVGVAAMAKRLEQPDQTVFGSKRLLGRKFHSSAVQRYRDRFPYALVPDEAGGVAVSLSRTRPTVTELTARILEAVKAGADQQLGRPCHRAVISVPAHFGDAQRAAVREAGLLAGLEVVRIVGEPTAAALAYGFGRSLAAKRLVVYDLGGGTFDVSVLTVSGDNFEVVATGGDDFLGGMDFDIRVVQRLLVALGEAGGPERPGPTILERLLEAAEEAKVALSEFERHRILLRGLWLDEMSGEPKDLDFVIHRADLESWTRDLVDRTTNQTLAVLEEKGLSPEQIDDVLLVGGQSRMPLVRESLEALFARAPRSDVDPEEAVALGCALLAGSLATVEDPKAPSVQLRDVLSMAIGLGVPDGRFMPVVEQNTPIPCERTLHVATSRDDQDSIEVVVFQGNVRYASDAEYLGTLSFVDLPPRPAGDVVLQLRFTLDEEGLLSVQATDEETGRSITRVLSTADSPEEVRSRLGRLETVIRDLAAPGGEMTSEPHPDRVDSGFLKGLRRKIFGRGG